MVVIIGRVQSKRDTTANWEYVNPILADGEIGLDDTIDNFKVGDGIHVWTSLSYWITTNSLNDIEIDFPAGSSTDLQMSFAQIPDVSAKGIFIYAELYYIDGINGDVLTGYTLYYQKIIYDNQILFRKSDPGDHIKITIKL